MTELPDSGPNVMLRDSFDSSHRLVLECDASAHHIFVVY